MGLSNYLSQRSNCCCLKSIILLFQLFLGCINEGATFETSGSIFEKRSQCQPIELPLCQDMPYNKTIFPNPFFEGDEISLQSQADHYKLFFNTKCNPHVQFFVCSTLVPMCPEQFPQALTSCRSVCEEVKKDCLEILEKIGLEWPETLNCSRFKSDFTKMCMTPPPLLPSLIPSKIELQEKDLRNEFSQPMCPQDLVDLNFTNSQSKCAFRCDKTTMFTRDKKEEAKFWFFILSLVNTTMTTFTALTFLINRQHFRFPEKSILYITICCLCYSLPYLLRYVFSFEKMACSRLNTGQRFLVQSSGQDNTICVASFLLTFYFETASALWWLILTFTWYLSAVRKWVEEEIEKRACYLHCFAWGLSSILTIVVLVSNKMDASELTGVCTVGNSDPWALLTFVVGPKFVLLFVGLCFIFSGFSSMCYERDSFKRRGTDTSKLNKFMLKMGSFCVLYVCPATISTLCNVYHFFQLLDWYPATTACKLSGGTYNGLCVRPEMPKAEYYIMNITMSFAVGIATGLWILSPKTCTSWRKIFCCFIYGKTTKQKYNGISEFPANSPLSSCNRYSVNAYQNMQQHYLLTHPLMPQQQHQIPNGNHLSNAVNLSAINNGNLSHQLTNGLLNGQNAPPPSSNSDFGAAGYGQYFGSCVTYYGPGNAPTVSTVANGNIQQQPPRYVFSNAQI